MPAPHRLIRNVGVGPSRIGVTESLSVPGVEPTYTPLPMPQAPAQSNLAMEITRFFSGAEGVLSAGTKLATAAYEKKADQEYRDAIAAKLRGELSDANLPHFRTRKASDAFWSLEAFDAAAQFDPATIKRLPGETEADAYSRWLKASTEGKPDAYRLNLFVQTFPMYGGFIRQKNEKLREAVLKDALGRFAGSLATADTPQARNLALENIGPVLDAFKAEGGTNEQFIDNGVMPALANSTIAGNVESVQAIKEFLSEKFGRGDLAELYLDKAKDEWERKTVAGYRAGVLLNKVTPQAAIQDAKSFLDSGKIGPEGYDRILGEIQQATYDRLVGKQRDALLDVKTATDLPAEYKKLRDSGVITGVQYNSLLSGLMSGSNTAYRQAMTNQVILSAADGMMKQSAGPMIGDVTVPLPNGSTTTLTREKILNLAVPVAVETAGAEVYDLALQQGKTQDEARLASLAAQIGVLSKNGVKYEKWENILNSGQTMVDTLIAGKPGDAPNEVLMGAYDLWRRVLTISPSVAFNHCDTKTASFYQLTDQILKYMDKPNPTNAMTMAANVMRNKRALEVEFGYREDLARNANMLTMRIWSKLQNRGEVISLLSDLANVYMKSLGVDSMQGLSLAKDRISATHTKINNRLIYTKDVLIPQNFDDVDKALRTEYFEKHREEGIENVEDIWGQFEFGQYVLYHAGQPVEDQEAGRFQTEELAKHAIRLEQEADERSIVERVKNLEDLKKKSFESRVKSFHPISQYEQMMLNLATPIQNQVR
jgi:hypothetical protein